MAPTLKLTMMRAIGKFAFTIEMDPWSEPRVERMRAWVEDVLRTWDGQVQIPAGSAASDISEAVALARPDLVVSHREMAQRWEQATTLALRIGARREDDTWLLPFLVSGGEPVMMTVDRWLEERQVAADKLRVLDGFTPGQIRDQKVRQALDEALKHARAHAAHEAICKVEEADVCQTCDSNAAAAEASYGALIVVLGYAARRVDGGLPS